MRKSIIKAGLVFNLILLLTSVIIIPGLNEKTEIHYNFNQSDIDIDSALKVANMKLFELGKSDMFYIKNSQEINGYNKKILFFLFNLYPQGFIIVSGDSSLPPVLYYSFTSSIFDNNFNDNILVDILKSDIELRLKNIENLPLDIIQNRQNQWNNFLTVGHMDLINTNFEQWPPEGTTNTEGWMKTQWTQTSPFNNFCPMDGNDRSIAGCPSIAMAQIINYHENTNGIRFDDNDDYYHNYSNYFMIDDDHEEYDFPSFPELNNYLTTLDYNYANDITLTDNDKAALTFACGVAAKQVYTADISGTFGVGQAYDAYLRFGCDSIVLFDGNNPNFYDRLIDNIKNAFPTHLALVTPDWTTGHNMVLDGYNTDDFYHINFGLGGKYDGWYLLPDEEMPYGLTVIEGIIIDIMNNKNTSNLECDGKLIWNDIQAGSIVTGNFMIKNIGMPGSNLNWEIESYPSWGTWNFSDTQGENLKPEDGEYTVEISVITPYKRNKYMDGSICIVNKESDGDSDYIPVALTTTKNKIILEPLSLRFLKNHQNLYQIIKRLISN